MASVALCIGSRLKKNVDMDLQDADRENADIDLKWTYIGRM